MGFQVEVKIKGLGWFSRGCIFDTAEQAAEYCKKNFGCHECTRIWDFSKNSEYRA